MCDAALVTRKRPDFTRLKMLPDPDRDNSRHLSCQKPVSDPVRTDGSG
jgi:hypothetical protein